MSESKKISRLHFFRIGLGLSVGFLVWIWYRLSRFQNNSQNDREYRHDHNLPMGLSHFDKYYLYRNDKGVRAFLNKCTHAGCKIGPGTLNTLQCNCHGSKFDAETGKPLKGPAFKPLQEIDCRWDEKSGQWVVRLQEKLVTTTVGT